MARNPLVSRLQTLFADFDEAERSGRSVAQIREERRLMSLTRRDFLKVTGAAVRAGALGRPAAAPAGGTQPARPPGPRPILRGGRAGLHPAPTPHDARITPTRHPTS